MTHRLGRFIGAEGKTLRYPKLLGADFTIIMWCKIPSGHNTPPTATQWDGGMGCITTPDWGISVLDSGKCACGTGTTTVKSTTLVNDGKWHCIVFTRVLSTGVIRLYIDGKDEGNATGPTTSYSTSGNCFCGAMHNESSGKFFPGIPDKIVFLKRVLSASEVAELYNNLRTNRIELPYAFPDALLYLHNEESLEHREYER